MVKIPRLEEDGSVQEWTLRWLSFSGEDEKNLIALICWNLWQNRNNVVWKNKPGTVESILAAASSQLMAWKVAHFSQVQLRSVDLLEGDGSIRWFPPKHGWLKANVDAAIFSGGRGYGIGVIPCKFRDESGAIVQARTSRFFGNISPRLAEAVGVREILSWLKDCSNLVIEFDAMELVLEIRNPSLADMDPVVGDCEAV
ncbi:uncharacterized protein LOC126668430 [Mercurialis annua]|uniref:uncharacterized protein LOC126668430 n=1 Tax=Mercurialis annua TaxID=3986 RepID=UPI00215FE6D6|nr:uncharacterized protein LOC126668430 [Mercurialis annua]